MNRRDFTLSSIAGVAGLALTSFLGGCTFESVWAQIQVYIPVGVAAFESIIALVAPLQSATLTTIAQEVLAAFSVLASAVNQYISAPATSKATLLEKVQLVLSEVVASIQAFSAALGKGSNPVVVLVTKLLTILLSTLEAFVSKIGTTPASVAAHNRVKAAIIVTPVMRSKKQFVAAFNAELSAGGHPELLIH